METGLASARDLLERDAELAAIDRAVEGLRAGGSLVIFSGIAGLGKSRLIESACRRAGEAGVPVLRARGLELEQGCPFGVTRQLFAAHVADGFGHSRPLNSAVAAAERLLADRLGAARDHGRIDVIHALRTLLARLARTHGVMVAVDDLQWSDTESLRFLIAVCGLLPDIPVAVVLAWRPPVHQHRAELIARLSAIPDAAVLPLAALGAGAVSALVERTCGAADRSFVVACAHASGGNPFLLVELLLKLYADRVAPTAAGATRVSGLVPESVLGAVAVRLSELSPAARSLAQALAVLADGAPLRRVATLAGVATDDAERGADELVRAGIVRADEPLEMRHPLIAAAVRADLPEFARRRARRRAAQLLADDGAPVEQVCSQLLDTRANDDSWVVAQLRTAGAAALAQGEPAAAVRLLRRALAEPPSRAERPAILAELGHAEAAVGDPAALGRLESAAALSEDPRARAVLFGDLARIMLPRGDYAAAARAARRGLDALAPDDPLAEGLSTVLLLATGNRPERADDVRPAITALRQGLAGGRLSRRPDLAAFAANVMATLGQPESVVRPLVDRALAESPLVEAGSHGMFLGLVAGALLAIDDLDTLRSTSEAAIVAANRRGSTIGRGVATHWRSVADVLTGRLDAARAGGECAAELVRSGWHGIAGWNTFYLARCYVELGELDPAEAVIARGRELHDDPSTRALILEARARLALARHDDAAALRDLLAVGEVAGETTQYLPVTFSWRSLAAIAAHRLGEQDRARGWIAEELEASTTHGAQVRGCALRAGGIVYGGDGGLELLQESVELLERSSCALEHAHSLLALGAALRRSGQHVRARSHLRRALDLAADFGAVPLAQQARDELRASGARPRRERTQGWGALTPSELRIATLAAAGRSTPEISRELVVSRKTVEWHLAHVFDKLGVRSRLQLRDAWSQSGRSDSSSATLETP